MGSQSLTERLRETLALFDGRGAPRTTSEVAEGLDLGRRSTYDRLEQLVDRGYLETKKVGASARVWWRPAADDPGDAGEALSRLIDNVPGMVYRCRNERGWPMTFVSDAAEALTGYDPAAVESGEVSYGGDVVHPDDRERVRTEVAAQLADGDRFTLEYRIVTADGDTRWVRERGCAVDAGGDSETVIEGVVTDVTDAERSRRALAERERQFRSLVEATDEYAICMLGPEGRVQTWNRGAERIEGYDADDVVGEHFSTFYTEADRADGVPAANLEAAAEEGTVEDEGWRVRADGSRFWAAVTITAVRDDDGSLRGYAKVTRDMTERREFERTLERERDLLERVLDATPVAIAVLDDGELVRTNERARRYLSRGADDEFGEVAFLDESGSEIPPEEAPYQRVHRTGEAVRDWEGRVELPDGDRRWMSLNVVPLTDADGDVERIVVSAEDVTQLKEQARHLERRRDELETELGEMLERVDDAFFALDGDWRFTYVNDRAATLLDRARAELVGRNVWDEFPGAADTAFETQYRRALETGESVSFVEYFAPLERWFEVSAYPSETGLSVYFRDVTERRARERELERYETIVETVDDGIYVVDEDGYFTEVNETYEEWIGRSREELLGEHVSTVVDDEETLREAERLEAALLADERATATLESEVETGDGETRVGEATFALIDGSDGHERVGVVRDVTRRKARERELERYEQIVETVDDGIYALDADDRFVLVNEAFCELVGYDRSDLLGRPAAALYDDEHVPVIRERAAAVASGEQAFATVELDLVRSDGDRVPVETRFEPFGDGDDVGRCGVVRDVTERLERERELQRRVRQQAVVTDLGQRALEERDIDALLAEATRQVAETLDTDYAELFELDRDAATLRVRHGVGLDDGVAGEATLPADEDGSQVARTLASNGPVVAEDLASEARFDVPDLLLDRGVRSGVTAVVGPPDDPWGVLGAHGTAPREFAEQDVNFLLSVAAILATAISRHRDERALVRQREQLAALNGLNEVVNGITDAVVDQSTRAEIEQTVCDHLAAADSYQFAWIGEVDPASRTVDVRAEAGVEGYLDDVTVSIDPGDERSQGPTGRAVQTGEMQTVQDVRAESAHDPWRDHVESHGFRSSAAIPIVYEGTTYGVLNVYADRPNAFEGRERAVVGQLGDVVGHAIAAAERKQALMSDEVVEIEFQIPGVFETVDLDADPEGRVSFDHVVPTGDDAFLVYGEVTDGGTDTVDRLVDALPHWTGVTFRDGGDGQFELRVDEPPVLSALASLGGSVESAVLEGGDYRMTLHLSPSADVRQVIEAVTDAYPTATMLRRQQVSETGDPTGPTSAPLTGLTDRQRTTLEAAHHAGFFEWPRDASGEEVAESLRVSPPTFHQHLRKAEQKVFDALFSSASG